MPFLTLEDPNAKIKGSRDPLGAQPVWSRFARHAVTNVTGAANSVRGFSILLLGRYYGARLIEEGRVPREETLDVVLRMEQLGAYARYVGHEVDDDIRGIERVKLYLDEHRGRPYIDSGHKGRILADQRVYGLWGLYTVSARASGLLPDGPIGVTEASAQLIEEVYRPQLAHVETPLLRLLAHGGRLNTRGDDPVFQALCDALPESYTPREVEFYSHYLRDALESETGGHHGRQGVFARLLVDHTNLEGPLNREEAITLAEAAAPADELLSAGLWRIVHLEALLAPADILFDHLLTQNGQTPENVATRLTELWGSSIPNLSPETFGELLPEIEAASTPEQARAMASCHAALASGKYDEAIRVLLAWNAEVMKHRRAAPWARTAGNGSIEVRYRGAERLLPEESELATLWGNQYFVDSLKKITRQLRNIR